MRYDRAIGMGARLPLSSGQGTGAGVPRAAFPIWLAVLFAFYGPALNLVGELRYVEIIVLVLLFFNAGTAFRYIGAWERRLVTLFGVAALAQIGSDIINDAQVSGTLKRAGTYLVLALLVVAIKWLGRGDPRRILFILSGFCASWVSALYIGQAGSANYASQPWRLGLGMAVTLAVCVVIAGIPPARRWGALALLVLAGVHLVMQSRSLAITTGLTGVLALIAQLRGHRPPLAFRPVVVVAAAAAAALAMFSVYEALRYAVEHNMLPTELQEKMETQARNPHGILAAGRPDTVAAMYAVTKQPLIGFGSTNVDPDVYAYYLDLAWSSYHEQANYEGLLQNAWTREWTLGTPSHSHLLGAWVDAGVLAALCWFAVLLLALEIIVRMSVWQHPMQPLFVLIALATMWDVLFSPGPQRLEMAIRLTVLLYGHSLLRGYDTSKWQMRQRSR